MFRKQNTYYHFHTTINLACVAMAMLQYGACACMLALTHARGRGLQARRQSNANCVPLKTAELMPPWPFSAAVTAWQVKNKRKK